MLYLRNRFSRNPYFHFHPMQSAFSLIATIALLGLLMWMLRISRVESTPVCREREMGSTALTQVLIMWNVKSSAPVSCGRL